MNRFWSLFKILFKNSLGLSTLARDRKRLLKTLGLGLLIIVGFAPTIALYTQILVKAYDFLYPLGQHGMIITLGLTMASTMIFYFGVFYIINTFYFTDYIRDLLALPLKAWQLLGAQFTQVVVYEYLTALPFVLPPLLVYGIKSQAPVLYWVYGLLALVFVPLFPLALAALPTIIIMRFSNLGRHRDLLKILGGVLVIAIAIGIQIPLQRSLDPGAIQQLLSQPGGLMEWAGRFFPNALFLGRALVFSDTLQGFSSFLSYIFLTMVAVAAAWLVGDRLYFAGLAGAGESPTTESGIRRSDWRVSQRSPFTAYFLKEIRMLLRTPPYFINCVLVNLMGPLILLIIPLLQPGKTSNLTIIAQHPRSPVIILLSLVGLMAFLAATNGITATSFSREGSQIYISRYIPLTLNRQALAKLSSGLLFGGLGAVFVSACAWWIFKLSPGYGLVLFILAVLAQVPVLTAGLLVDLYNPKLDWENEQAAVKRNFNVLFSMLAAVVLIGGPIWAVYLFNSPLKLAVGFLLGCLIVESLLLAISFARLAGRQYQRLEA